MISCLSRLGKEVSNQLNSGVKLRDLEKLVMSYCGKDWGRYNYKSYGPYDRRKVYSDDNVEVVLISWTPHCESGIHDHPQNGCLMRVMQGVLIEENYKLSKLGLEQIDSNRVTSGTITYQEGIAGLHNVINPTDEIGVSVHVYAPPNYEPFFYS